MAYTPKRYLRLKKEAERTDSSTRTILRRIAEDGYPYIKAGGVLLFDPELSDQWYAERAYRGRAAELAKTAA